MELRVLHYFFDGCPGTKHHPRCTVLAFISANAFAPADGSGSGNRQAAADPGQPANCPDGGRDAAAQTSPGNPGPGGKTENELAAEETVAGDIYIGAGETDGLRILLQTAKSLQREYPGIRLHIVSGDAPDIVEKLDKGLIDFALILRRSRFFRLFNAGAACPGSLGRVIATRSSAGRLPGSRSGDVSGSALASIPPG